MVNGLTWSVLLPLVVVFLLPLLVNSGLTMIRVLVGTFFLHAPIALAAANACYGSPGRWFSPHFSVSAEFSLSAWDTTVDRARTHSPLWPACWLQYPDRSRSSASQEVRDIWDVYIREVGFVPFAVREQLFRLSNSLM